MKKEREQPRAVIYNRCSTEEESQKDALIRQVQESKNCVREQGWKLVDTYVEAKSGTTVKGRSEYNRLYQDLERNTFDIIVIKSQDRLMRNTKDWYLFLERMQKNRKKLYMYLEGKFYTPDDALITGIKAILAEEYSRELSKKVNNAHKNRQKEGKHFVFTSRMYGLKKLPDKRIGIDEHEAEMIRLIFQLSANGYGTHSSAEILYKNGYRNRQGKMILPSMLRNIIRNPVYKGTVVQNKRHYEFESKQTVNNPEPEWIVHEDAVPAIVDERLFEAANRAMDQRKRGGRREKEREGYGMGGKHVLSGKIVCGLCKEPYYRTVRRNRSGRVAEWKCSNYLHNGRRSSDLRKSRSRESSDMEETGCDNIHINEEKLILCLMEMDSLMKAGGPEEVCGCGNRYCPKKDRPEQEEILAETMLLLRKALEYSNGKEKQEILKNDLERAVCRRDLLLEKLLEGVVDDQVYRQKNREIQEQIDYCKEKIQTLESDIPEGRIVEERLENIKKRLEQDVIKRAQGDQIVSEAVRIVIFPGYMEVFFSDPDCPDIAGTSKEKREGRNACERTSVRIEQNCGTSNYPVMKEQKKRIWELIQKDPKITAKQIAAETEMNLSLVRRRIRSLKEERRIGTDK